jgi:hypothetical protein
MTHARNPVSDTDFYLIEMIGRGCLEKSVSDTEFLRPGGKSVSDTEFWVVR